MLGSIVRRLIAVPIILLAVYLGGYAYALVAAQANKAESPFAAQASAPPVVATTLTQLGNLVRLDFGQLPDGRGPVAGTVFAALGNSFGLLLIAFVMSVVLGLALGFVAVRWNPSRLARWLLPVSTVGVALPSFYIGIVLTSVLLRLPQSPLPVSGFGFDAHLVLPLIALALRPAFQLAQVTAGLIVGEAGQQYVVAARAVGNSFGRTQRRHILRNVIAPVILSIASSFRLLVAELVVVEWLFGWPGMGRLLAGALIPPTGTAPETRLFAALYLHPPTLALIFTVLAFLFVMADLLATAAAQASDPRLRRATSADAATPSTEPAATGA